MKDRQSGLARSPEEKSRVAPGREIEKSSRPGESMSGIRHIPRMVALGGGFTVRVETQYGPIDVKVAQLNGHIVKEMPEYEQCRLAAREANVPLRVVQDAVRQAFAKQAKTNGRT